MSKQRFAVGWFGGKKVFVISGRIGTAASSIMRRITQLNACGVPMW
jgi:hypothetical protein